MFSLTPCVPHFSSLLLAAFLAALIKVRITKKDGA